MLMKNERCLIRKFNQKIVEKCLFSMVLVIGFVFNTGFYYDRNVYMNLEDIVVELGDKLPEDIATYADMLPPDSGLSIENSVPRDEDGHTTLAGEYRYYIVYNDNTMKVSKLTNVKATIEVVDTINPVIIFKEKLEFKYGSKIKISDIATCDDLSSCEMQFEEEVDSETSGKQTVTVIAKDSSNNVSMESVEITILEKPKPVVNYAYSASYKYMDENNNLLNSRLTEEEKNNLRNQIVSFAKQFVGNPYVYGGTSLTNGTDCSGFTMSVYQNFGYMLPRVSTSQNYVGMQVYEGELLPGDLVVYHYGHVGIYLGNGKMVHAGTEKTGIVIAPIFSGYKSYRRIIY